MESPGAVRRLAATLESGRDSHSCRTGAVLRHRQEAGQRSPRHGHYYKSETTVNLCVYLFADAAVAAAAATTAMIAAATAEATRVVCDELIYSNVFVLVASTCHHHEFDYPNSFVLFFEIFL